MITVQDFISSFNSLIFIIFMLLYAYQLFYILVAFFRKPKEKPQCEVKQHKYGFLIAARNESSVIGHLVDSIRQQDYPAELVHVFVVADNCTDDTAQVAREAGAAVISLGKRILRAETAAVTAVGLGMLHVEMNLGGDEQ